MLSSCHNESPPLYDVNVKEDQLQAKDTRVIKGLKVEFIYLTCFLDLTGGDGGDRHHLGNVRGW